MEEDKDLSKANDGFQNLAAKLGFGPGQVDNMMSRGSFVSTNLTRNRLQLDAAYRGNWLVGQVVDSVADDMTSAGITIAGEMDPDDISVFQKRIQSLGIWDAYNDLKKWSRLYGGAIAVIQIDGQDLASPLRMDTIKKDQFLGLSVYDRWVCDPDMQMLIPSGFEMGMPMYYNLQGIVAGAFLRVHHSRVIRDIGIKLPYWEAQNELLWGMSVVERMEDRLMSFETATAGAASLVNKAYLRTISVDNLRGILAAGGVAESNLIKMFQYVRLLQSSEGLTIIDKNDNFATASYSFAGLPEVLSQFAEQLSGAVEIPLVRLFGQSPTGFNNGESDLRNYYGKILSKQESTMRAGLSKILKVLHKSVFGIPAPDDFDFGFNSLWQMSEKEKSDVAKVNGETISAALNDGSIDVSTAQKELKQQSSVTGMFTNITSEMITASENEPPPKPVEEDPIGE